MADPQLVNTCLQQLAAELAASGQPLKAIKCLETLLRQSLLPTLEAQTRLQIARLLLDHTDCLQQARDHLLKGEQRLARVPGEAVLKMEVAAALAEAYQHLGQHEYQQLALEAAIRLTLADPATLSSSQHPDWTCYFVLRLAHAVAAAGQHARALELAQQGHQLAAHSQLLQEQVLLLLLQLQLHTATWDREAAQANQDALDQLAGQLQQPGGALTPLAALQLQAHHVLLQALFCLRLGRFTELHLKPTPQPSDAGTRSTNLLQQLDALQLQLQQQQPGSTSGYEWLPLELLGPLVALLWGHVHKARGEVAEAKAKVTAGLDEVQQRLSLLQSAKHRLHVTAAPLRLALAVQLLLRDCQLQVLLLNTDYPAAQQVLAASMAAFDSHPQQLAGCLPLVQCEAGLYGLALEEYGAAAAQFVAAAQHAEPALLRPGCQALAALALLGQGTPAAATQAIDLLGDSFHAVLPALGYSERAVAGLAAGTARLQRGEVLEAKARLGQALNLAYKQLANNQLVAQVLMLMAPTQMATESGIDRSGALDMVKTAVVLSRNAGDLRCVTGALRMTQQVLRGAGEGSSTAALQNDNYMAKKQQELSGKLQAVGADELLQQRLLQWRLG